MLVWRLCRRPFADLSGQGGLLASGRWHIAGKPVVYTAYEPALAILEVRVHLDLSLEDLPEDYVMMGIDLGDLAGAGAVAPNTPASLPESRIFGDAWLKSLASPVLAVPSVLAPRGINILINPLHPDAGRAVVTEIIDFKFDSRLW